MAFWQSWLIFLWITCFLSRSLITAAPCFITNCPPGGKRSSPTPIRQFDVINSSKIDPILRASGNTGLLPIPPAPSCLACGPNGGGRCLGPHLCCGPSIGCYFKTKETQICSWSPVMASCDPMFHGQRRKPCRITWAEVDDDEATCVANGICCSSGRCQIDITCRLDHISYERQLNVLATGYDEKIK